MHRLWTIPEVVQSIVGWVPAGDTEQEWKKTLASLARTARLFCIPASSILWADVNLDNLAHLLSLHEPWKDESPTGQQSVRFLAHEERFRSLIIAFKDGLSSPQPRWTPEDLLNTFNTIIQARPARHPKPLPRLTRLVICIDPGNTVAQLDFLHAFSKTCLVSSLRELHYTCYRYGRFDDESTQLVESMIDLFPQIVQSCPDMHTVKIQVTSGEEVTNFERLRPVIDGITTLVQALIHLKVVELPGRALQPALLQALSALSQLEELSIHDRPGQTAPLRPFPPVSTHNALQVVTIPALRTLEFGADWRLTPHILPYAGVTGGVRPEPRSEMPLVESVHIDGFWNDKDSDTGLTISDVLAKLKFCPNIIHLELDLPVVLERPASDDDIQLIASTWPNLESLVQWVNYGYQDTLSHITGRSLVTLATECPKLSKLQIYVGSIGEAQVPNEFEASDVKIDLSINVTYWDFDEDGEDPEETLNELVEELWPASRECTVQVEYMS